MAAGEARKVVKKDGFSALFFPGIIALALMTSRLRETGALKIVPPPAEGGLDSALGDVADTLARLGVDAGDSMGAVVDALTEALRARTGNCGERSRVRLHIGKTVQVLLEDEDNPAMRQIINRLVEAGQRKRGVVIPNAPPDGVPYYTHVVYERVPSEIRLPPGIIPPVIPPELHERRSIAFTKVLDLGVGYSHWHEHWQLNYGGEMHNLLGTRPLFQQERYNLLQYRFLNGPVVDGDGWNDGTTNFYILVKLGGGEASEPPSRTRDAPAHKLTPDARARTQRYAILWLDEQTYFTQRWRMLHATKDTAGDLFSLQRVLRDSPEYFRFDSRCFWCPFEHDCIDDASRMAVVRQIVAVSGRDPDTHRPEIYTICFNYGVSDYTWRWRAFPESPNCRVLDQDIAGSHGQLPSSDSECLFTNTLGLREDGTLHVRGFRLGTNGRLVEGRWFQKYLPADLRHTPRCHQLQPNTKPGHGFDHAWDFICEDAWRRVEHYFLTGAYAQTVDARCQYYEVELLPDESGRVPSIDDVEGVIWRNESVNGESLSPLRIDTVNFNWALPRDDENYLKLDELTVDYGQAPTMSMYETTTRFRLMERKPLGLIAVFFDKRDDELQSASHLPQATLFIEDLVPLEGCVPAKATVSAQQVRLLVKSRRRVLQPPIVQRAVVTRVRSGGVTTSLEISFWTSLSTEQVHEGLWRLCLEALDRDGTQVPLFGSNIFPHFVRMGVPAMPLPADFTMADVITPEYQHTLEWRGFNIVTAGLIDLYCTPEGRVWYATSLWFEDVVGHLSTPQALEFASTEH